MPDNNKVQQALQRLNGLLPLQQRQQQLDPEAARVHRQILRSFCTQGHAPEELDTATLQQLQQQDMIVLNSEAVAGDSPVTGAYPFSLEDTPHRISVHGHTLHAMCALDALSVAPMFDTGVSIDSLCHMSGAPVHIRQRGDDVLEATPAQPIRVGIRWQPPGQCAAHSLCREMIFLVGDESATQWQAGDAEHRELFDLPTAIALGSAFFSPLVADRTLPAD